MVANRLLSVVLAFLALTGSAFAVDPDWNQVEHEAADFLSEYIKIDTTNPPGNEIAAAQFLRSRFTKEGIEAQVFESTPGRGSVIARLKGTGSGRPIILLNHLDVVPANREEWRIAPFSGEQNAGFVHGRGTLDCKGGGTIQAMSLLFLKRHQLRPPRDVIFLGTADEEAGGKFGAGWFVETQFDKIQNAEFVLNEGGHIRPMPNGGHAWQVAVAEKTPYWLRLTANGQPGHGSTPPRATAVTRLVRALARLQDLAQTIRVTPEVQAYFQALAALQTDVQSRSYLDLRAALGQSAFRQEFLLDPYNAALVQDTITPTVLVGSSKTNVIPRTAIAELDCRLLPDTDPRAFLQSVIDTIADPGIEVEVTLDFPPSSSHTDTQLYRVLTDQAEKEGARIVPSVLTGFTDSHYFREKGIVSYGFMPFILSETDTQGEHGVNERISTVNLRDGTRRLVETLMALE